MAAGGQPSALRFLVIQDHKENLRKCSVSHLGGTEGVKVVRLSRPRPGETEPPLVLPAGILLDPAARALRPRDRELLGPADWIVLLDASWARVPVLERRLGLGGREVPLVRRALPGAIETAYPRRSKLYEDPPGGLATVEAMFAAAVILGSPRPALLEGYHFRDAFLERNASWLGGPARNLTSSGD